MKTDTKNSATSIAIERLREEAGSGDVESAHASADRILCELLIELGYGNVVEAWEEVPKWYA